MSIVEVGGEYFSALSSNCRSASAEQLAIGVDRQVIRDLGHEMVTIEACLELPQRCAHDVSKVVAIEMHGKIARVNSQHLNGIGHQRLEPIQVFVDDGDQLAITRARRRAGQQIARRRFHRGERRFELVRQRIQHRRPQFAALMRRLGARRGFLRPGSLEPNGGEVRNRVQHGVGEAGVPVADREAANGRAAELNGDHDQPARVA